jgi:NAD(P)-dependent dehydrogenase (short-subunit alcohol dehydrogenase family)
MYIAQCTLTSAHVNSADGGVSVEISSKRVLVTGANRGLGAQLVEALLARDADRVYAGVRDTRTLVPAVARHGDRVVPVRLDVTDPADIQAVVDAHDDIELLVSNAGQACVGPVVSAADESSFRSAFEVNFFGPLTLVRALGPQLKARSGGVLFVLSLAALVISRSSPIYSASKAAAMMLAMAVRSELKADGVVVTSSFPGFIDTDMTAGVEIPKAPPRVVADRSLDGWQAGCSVVFPDRLAELVEHAVHTNMAAVLDDPQAVMTELIRALRRDTAG